jgi:hypothetical protein
LIVSNKVTVFRDLGRRLSEAQWVALGATVFALLFAWPILPHLGQFGAFHDWEFTTELHWVPYYTLVHYHQFPLWNPYKCGGMAMFANPQSRLLTPFLLLHLLFGPVIGLQLEIIAHLAIAWGGGYVLARSLGLRPLSAVTCASVFPASSWFFLHIGEGHAVFLPATYLPWAASFYGIAINRRRMLPAACGGLTIALMFFEGGLYVGIFAVVLIATIVLPMVLTRWSLWPLWSAITMAVFTAGFAAIKLLPAVAFFKLYPRGFTGGEGNQWSIIRICLFSRYQDILRSGPGSFGFQEYGAYISMTFVVLALCGSIYGWRRPLPWLIAALIFAKISQGDIGQHPLWNYLRSEKIFGGMLVAMRLPQRFLIGAVMAASVLAGIGTELLCTILRRSGPIVAGALLTIGLVDCWFIGPPNLKLIFRDKSTVLDLSPQFQQMRQLGAKGNMTHVAMANMGALECYEYTDIRTNAVGYDQPGYRGEQYLTGSGTANVVRWTPDALTYAINAPRPTVLIVNQNYNEGWRISSGRGEVFASSGLIGVRVPAGIQRLTLTYRSVPFLYGLALNLVACAAMVLLWCYDL